MARGFALTLLAVACAALLAGCGSDAEPTANTGRPAGDSATLTDIESVLELRAAFNEDGGSPRLLLILSPT